MNTINKALFKLEFEQNCLNLILNFCVGPKLFKPFKLQIKCLNIVKTYFDPTQMFKIKFKQFCSNSSLNNALFEQENSVHLQP